MDNEIHKPLLIAAGGGGRGYNSHADDQKEIMDMDPQVPGRNGLSAAAGSLSFYVYCFIILTHMMYKQYKKKDEEKKKIGIYNTEMSLFFVHVSTG